MEYINRQVLRTIEENEEEIAKGNGTSKTYDKRIIREDDTAITAAVRLSLSEQRKKFQKSAVLDAANGFRQYKLSWKVDTSVLDDPDIGSTFFPVKSAKVTKEPTALNDNDDDNSPSGNDIPVPPPEEVPKVAGVVPPIPDNQAEIGQDKTGQDKTGKRYGWTTYGEKTSPLKYNRFVFFTNIKDDNEDSSDDNSIPPPPKEPDKESDAVINHVLDSELWDEAVPDDELCFEKIVCIPDDDPTNKAPKGTVNDDDEVKVVKVVPAGENSKSKGIPSPKASISSKKAVAHAPDTGSKKRKGNSNNNPSTPPRKKAKKQSQTTLLGIRQSPRILEKETKRKKDKHKGKKQEQPMECDENDAAKSDEEFDSNEVDANDDDEQNEVENDASDDTEEEEEHDNDEEEDDGVEGVDKAADDEFEGEEDQGDEEGDQEGDEEGDDEGDEGDEEAGDDEEENDDEDDEDE